MQCVQGASIYQSHIVSGNLKMSAKKLPAWAEAAFTACGKEYFYLWERMKTYLMGAKSDGFLREIEAELPAVAGNGSSQAITDTDWQRIQFFQIVILYADYFAPSSSANSLENRPSAIKDMRTQKVEAKKILGYLEKMRRSLDLHHDASSRLSALPLDCDPFQIIEDMDARANEGEGYLRGIRDEFQMLMLRRGPILQAAKDLSDFTKAVSHRIETSMNATNEHWYKVHKAWLGVEGHKQASHYFAALDEWIARNSNTETDSLPEGFSLSDKSLSELGMAFGMLKDDLSPEEIAKYRFIRKTTLMDRTKGSCDEY